VDLAPLARYVPAPLRSWYQTEHGRKMVRYSMVSLVAVPVAELGILMGLVLFGMSAAWANVFGNSLGAIPSYYLNRTWVWGKAGRSHLMKEIAPFWMITVVGVVFAGWVGHVAGAWAKRHDVTGPERVILLMAANLVAFGVLWVGKYILFNTVLFKVHPPHDGQAPSAAQAHEAGLAGAAGAPELD
jgi:putative flippase GtrA